MKRTKAAAILLVMIMALSLMPTVAFAATRTVGSGGTYITMDALLIANVLADGDTIELLENMGCSRTITINGISVTLQTNGYTLTVTADAPYTYGLYVNNGGKFLLDTTGGGEFNVTCSGGPGVCADGAGSVAEVNNATNTYALGVNREGDGARATAGGKITITGNVRSSNSTSAVGAYADGTGSIVTVTSDANGQAGGAWALNGGVVTVGGNASGNSPFGYGAIAEGTNSTVTVTGNVMGNYGASAQSGGTITIDGTVIIGGTVTGIVRIDSTYKTLSDITTPTTKTGYYTYSNPPAAATVWVKGSAPAITTASLPNGTVGTAYSQTLAATGDPTITWSLASGVLPSGLSLVGNVITGTPTSAGAFNFTVKAENGAGDDTKALAITIAAANATLSPTTANYDKNGGVAPATTLTLNSNTLIDISDGTNTLVPGTGYTVAGSVYTISAAYLNSRPVGTTTLTFNMSGGTNPTFAITISDSSLPGTYALAVQAGAGGSITMGTSGNYAAGTTINIAATANSGYRFDRWTTSSGGTFGNANSASTTFTMPGNATSITASFIQDVRPPSTLPKTGDGFPIGPLLALMVVSLAGLGWMGYRTRRQRRV